MGQAKELDKLVVRLVGNGSSYKKVLDNAIRHTGEAADDIDKITKKQLGKQNHAMREAARATEAVAEPTKQYAQELEALERVHKKNATSTKAHARAIDTLNQKYSKGVHAVGAFSRKMHAAGRRMRNMGAVMFVSLTLPAVGAIGTLLKLGASAETVRVQFETMLGRDQGRAMIKRLREFASVTPFRFPKLAESARTLIGFGVAQKDVMRTMKTLGDVSAGTGKDVNELAVIFGQIKALGRLQGQDMMQLVNAGISYNDIAKTMGISASELKGEIEAGNVAFEVVEKTLQRLTTGGGRFNNMMEKLSQTTSGKFSTLLDKIGLLSQQMGEYLLPTANKVIDAISKAVDWFSALDPMVHKIVMGITALVGILGPVLILLGAVSLALGAMGIGLGVVVSAGLSVASTIGLWVGGLGAAVIAIKMLVDKIWGKGSFVAALRFAGRVGLRWTKNMIGFMVNIRENWGLLTKWLRNNWINILKDMGQAVMVYFSNTISNTKTAFHTMVRLFTFTAGVLKRKIEEVWTLDFPMLLVTGLAKAAELFNGFATKISEAWDALKSGKLGKASSVGDSILEWAADAGEQMIKDFNKGAHGGSFIDGVGDILKEQMGKMKGPLEGFETNMGKLPDFILDMNKAVERETNKGGEDDAIAAGEKEKNIGKDDPAGEFKTMSLRRFSVNPVVAQRTKKQEVTDKNVADKLDILIEQGQGGTPATVMAR